MSNLPRPLAAAVLAAVGLAAQAELAGSWAVTFKGQRATIHSVLTVERVEDGYAGSVTEQRGTRKLDAIIVDGDLFAFEYKRRIGRRLVNLRYVGQVSGDSLSGTVRTRWGWWPFAGKRRE